jgi:hypothetical protein
MGFKGYLYFITEAESIMYNFVEVSELNLGSSQI